MSHPQIEKEIKSWYRWVKGFPNLAKRLTVQSKPSEIHEHLNELNKFHKAMVNWVEDATHERNVAGAAYYRELYKKRMFQLWVLEDPSLAPRLAVLSRWAQEGY